MADQAKMQTLAGTDKTFPPWYRPCPEQLVFEMQQALEDRGVAPSEQHQVTSVCDRGWAVAPDVSG